MKKVLDKALEKKCEGIIDKAKDSAEAASTIVEVLRSFQDAGGMKVCQNVTTTDLAYKELK
ncbi:hypothetical protein LCGC14_1222320 [marine sediment metagenome]|uniref:Uncharacterized protein n=1 Tax=marine sediment metagenome TaxID=412755 RepID=A0A0F9LAY8_9ZZZZ